MGGSIRALAHYAITQTPRKTDCRVQLGIKSGSTPERQLMSVNQPYFPYWTGITPNRESLQSDKRPNAEDFDQITAEVLAVQDCFQQPHIADIPSNPTNAELATVVNMILAALRESKIILPL